MGVIGVMASVIVTAYRRGHPAGRRSYLNSRVAV